MVGEPPQPLRLFHFHGFDPKAPGELSTRFDESTADLRESSRALDELCQEYADIVLMWQEKLGPAPAYRYANDTSGQHLGRQVRRAYRLQSLEEGAHLPSPYLPSDAAAFAAWRKQTRKSIAKSMADDAVKAVRATAPEAAARFKSRFPQVVHLATSKVVRKGGIWG